MNVLSHTRSIRPVSFRLSSKKLALTYPKCPVDLQPVLDAIVAKFIDNVDYVVVCRERHENGDYHIHAAVLLKSRVDIKNARHLDLVNGEGVNYHGNYQACKSFDRWVDYVKKDGVFVQFGDYKTKQEAEREIRQAKNQLLISKTVQQAVDDGDIGFLQAHNLKLAKIAYNESVRKSNSDYNKQRVCVWLYGEPGTGKSAWVRQEYGNDLYYKTPDKWWDNYMGERSVILEDLDKVKATELGQYLKLWADNYNFSGECKGGRKFMDYTGFYITSNFMPRDLWKNPMMLKAIERRFKFMTPLSIELDDDEEGSGIHVTVLEIDPDKI